MRVSEREFIKRITPLVCLDGKKFRKMQAQQIYALLRDVGFIIVSEKELRERHSRAKNQWVKITIEEILREK